MPRASPVLRGATLTSEGTSGCQSKFMATINYSTEPRTLSEAGIPVPVNSHDNWHPYTCAHTGRTHTIPRRSWASGLQSGREHRGGHFRLDENRSEWGGGGQSPQPREGHSQMQAPPNRTFPSSNSAPVGPGMI